VLCVHLPLSFTLTSTVIKTQQKPRQEKPPTVLTFCSRQLIKSLSFTVSSSNSDRCDAASFSVTNFSAFQRFCQSLPRPSAPWVRLACRAGRVPAFPRSGLARPRLFAAAWPLATTLPPVYQVVQIVGPLPASVSRAW